LAARYRRAKASRRDEVFAADFLLEPVLKIIGVRFGG
jgi:hypothetical protein